MTELITSTTGCSYGKAKEVDVDIKCPYDTTEAIDSSFSTPFNEFEKIDIMFDLKYEHGSFKSIFSTNSVPWNEFEELDLTVRGVRKGISLFGSYSSSTRWNEFEELDLTVRGVKNGTKPVQASQTYKFRATDIQYSKPNPDADFRYFPTTDFAITSELVELTTDFDEPIDYDLVKTKMSPVDSSTSLPWDKTNPVDAYQRLTYGYGINDFLVGGAVKIGYLVDDDAINPVDPPIITEVIRLVNVINVVKLPERTPVNWTNLTLALDTDSIAWVANFDIADEATLNMIKPDGLNVVDLEIDINGEIWTVFVARTSTSLKGDRVKGVQRSIRCTCYSRTKLLSYPYADKSSRVETSASTPSGILNAELALSSVPFTGTWTSPSWTLPANRFSYFDLSPLAAISELASSIGSVVVPPLTGDTISIEPRYPISPWNWATAIVDRTLNESEFFSSDTNWQPRTKPDSIYVYGEENGGAAVKCVRQGTAGISTMPNIVNKYITDTIAGTERGRIEVSKEYIDEVVPITTYVSTVDGVVQPRELLEINALGGGTWRGMVSKVSLSITRNGSAIIQALDIERYYE